LWQIASVNTLFSTHEQTIVCAGVIGRFCPFSAFADLIAREFHISGFGAKTGHGWNLFMTTDTVTIENCVALAPASAQQDVKLELIATIDHHS
jgi:N-acetylglutamate synthase/N-acetylornithine aminotransferase